MTHSKKSLVQSGSSSKAASDNWRPRFNPWLIAVVVTLAAFMEILDTTIVNVALPYIAGSLSVSSDQATYALTSYLVANGIVLTISGWISDRIGRKRYFIACIAMFTICSFLCGISGSLAQLVTFRLLQGFFGGGLQPNQQSIILDTFEPAKRGAAFSVAAVAIVAGPALGPTLGGYITDQYSWRWIFFVNIPVGIIAVVANYFLVEDPPWEKKKQTRKRGLDFIGLTLITIGLGCFQIMIDRGEDDDWFGSRFIVVMALLAFIGIFGAIAWLLTAKNPIVSLEVFKDRNFATGCFLVSAFSVILYSTSVLVPQFAQQVIGYTAYIAGLILSPGGLTVIILITPVGWLIKRVQTRYIVMFGFALMGCALLYTSGLVIYVDYRTLVLMRVSQSTALAFLFVPISTIAYLTLPPRYKSDGAALFSMLRNVAGSVGISLSTAMVVERTQADQAHLSKYMSTSSSNFSEYIATIERSMVSLGRAPGEIHDAAVAMAYQTYLKQATVLGYSDVFLYISVLALMMVPPCFFISNKMAKGRASGH